MIAPSFDSGTARGAKGFVGLKPCKKGKKQGKDDKSDLVLALKKDGIFHVMKILPDRGLGN